MSYKSTNIKSLKKNEDSRGLNKKPFNDELGINPPPSNKTGPISSDLPDSIETYGANVPDTIKQSDTREYGQSYVFSTPGGHVIEYNDTSANEKVMIRHKSGSGVQINPDGSVITSAAAKVDIVNEGYTMTVHGDASIDYVGDLTMNVKGDFNLNVEGSYNVNALNAKTTVKDFYDEKVGGNKNTTVTKNNSNYVLGTKTDVTLGEQNIFAKGALKFAVESEMTLAIKGQLGLSSQTRTNISSPDMNIAAQNLSVFGDTGTIGGENIIMYNYNMHTGNSVWSKTLETETVRASKNLETVDIEAQAVVADDMKATWFWGNLRGTAQFAEGSNIIGSWPSASGADSLLTVTPTPPDTLATALPNAALLDSYLTKGSNGVKKVSIDPGDTLKKSIDLSEKNGGVSNEQISTKSARRFLREKTNRDNEVYTGAALASGQISAETFKPTPPSTNSIVSGKTYNYMGSTPLGPICKDGSVRRVKAK